MGTFKCDSMLQESVFANLIDLLPASHTQVFFYLTNLLIGNRYTSIVQYGLLVPSQFFLSCKPAGTSMSSHTVSKPASYKSISATCPLYQHCAPDATPFCTRDVPLCKHRSRSGDPRPAHCTTRRRHLAPATARRTLRRTP
jgi:hypothetical protein